MCRARWVLPSEAAVAADCCCETQRAARISSAIASVLPLSLRGWRTRATRCLSLGLPPPAGMPHGVAVFLGTLPFSTVLRPPSPHAPSFSLPAPPPPSPHRGSLQSQVSEPTRDPVRLVIQNGEELPAFFVCRADSKGVTGGKGDKRRCRTELQSLYRLYGITRVVHRERETDTDSGNRKDSYSGCYVLVSVV